MVEAVAGVVDETAAAAGEVVLFEDSDGKACFGETGCCCYASYSGAWGYVCQLVLLKSNAGYWSSPTTMAVFCLEFEAIGRTFERCSLLREAEDVVLEALHVGVGCRCDTAVHVGGDSSCACVAKPGVHDVSDVRRLTPCRFSEWNMGFRDKPAETV